MSTTLLIQQKGTEIIQIIDHKHSENVIAIELKKTVIKFLSFLEELQERQEEALLFDTKTTPAAKELIKNFQSIFQEILQYLRYFSNTNVLSTWLKNKNYSIVLIQIHQAAIATIREIKTILLSSAATTNIDTYFNTENLQLDFNTTEIIRKFNNEFFSNFLYLDEHYLFELIAFTPEEKYELFTTILTEITSDQLQHLLGEVNKITDASNVATTRQKLKNIFALYILEDAIASEDIVVNTTAVITDGMFGKICLGTLKNSDIYSSSTVSLQKKGSDDTPIQVAIELIYLKESFINKQRFGREIDALRKLSNAKCVLKVYGWIPLLPENSRPVIGIVTETWHRTLTSLVLDDTFEPTIDAWLRYLLEIVKALSHIKRSGIIYRTLKADSIVITSANNAVISDLSLTFNQNYITTRTTIANTIKVDSTNNHMIGSIGYTAPETYKGKVYDTTDIYALGILIAFVLLRESPWADEHHVVMYSPQVTREPKFVTRNDFQSFQQDSIDIFRKCCDPNHKHRSTLADVEKALKREYTEVSKQLRVLQKTKSQLNVMKNVDGIATIQGVPIPKVPAGAIKSRPVVETIPPPAPAVEAVKEDLVIDNLEMEKSRESNNSILSPPLSAQKPEKQNDVNNMSFLSVLSDIPNIHNPDFSDDDDSIILEDDPIIPRSNAEGTKSLSQEDSIALLGQTAIAESIDVSDSQYPFHHTTANLQSEDLNEDVQSSLPLPKRVKFHFEEDDEKANAYEEIRVIDLNTYQFQVETIEDFVRELRILQRSCPQYSSIIPLVFTILEKLAYFIEMNPSQNSVLIIEDKIVLDEIISYYQLFLVDVGNDVEFKSMLLAIVTHWTIILIRFCYNYEDTYFQQAATPTGVIDEGNGVQKPVGLEMTVTNQTINHYHALTEAPIHVSSGSEDPSDPNKPATAPTAATTLTHGTIPYFHYNHILILTNQQLLTVLPWFVEQVFLEKNNIYYSNHVVQLNVLQLLLILLFPKENKQLFAKQGGLKILLLLLTKYFNHTNVIIIHNVLLMIVNLFFLEENIIRVGKLMNACEIITNVLNYHKVYIESNSSLRINPGNAANHGRGGRGGGGGGGGEVKDNGGVEGAGGSLFYCHANVELLLEIVRDLAYYIEFQYEFSQFNIVAILVDVLSLYTYHPEIILPTNHPLLQHPTATPNQLIVSQQQLLLIEKALEAIICLSMNDTNEIQFGQQGVCELLYYILKVYGFQYSKITENIFNAIRNLSKNHENKLLFSEIGTCELIVKLLTHYIHLANKRTSKRGKKNSNLSASGSGDEASDSGSVLSENKSKISSITGPSTLPQHSFPSSYPQKANSATASIGSGGGTESVISSHEIIKSALSAITNLSVNLDNKIRFGQCQACELVIIILHLFGKKSIEITKKAFAAIGNLSVTNENKQRFANNISTNIGNQMVTIHSFEVIIFLLQKYSLQNIDISKKGLAAIGNLSVNNENKIKLGAGGINKVLVDILRTYALANEEVAQNGLGALANLAAYAQNNREFIELSIDEIVIEIMIFYEKKYQVINHYHHPAGPGGGASNSGGGSNQSQHKQHEHDIIYLEILKNGFGAINKFINNSQIENIKRFSEYNLCDGIVNLLKKIIINYSPHGPPHHHNTTSPPPSTAAGGANHPQTSQQPSNALNNLEIIKQMFQTINYLIIQPKNIKKFRKLGLKELLKKYFAENEKAAEIVVKISRTNSLFW